MSSAAKKTKSFIFSTLPRDYNWLLRREEIRLLPPDAASQLRDLRSLECCISITFVKRHPFRLRLAPKIGQGTKTVKANQIPQLRFLHRSKKHKGKTFLLWNDVQRQSSRENPRNHSFRHDWFRILVSLLQVTKAIIRNLHVPKNCERLSAFYIQVYQKAFEI